MIPRHRIALALACAIALAATAVSGAPSRQEPAKEAASGYERRADVREFIDQLAREDGLSRATLRRWFRDARYQPAIVAAMERPRL